jgi:hypothetical protein
VTTFPNLTSLDIGAVYDPWYRFRPDWPDVVPANETFAFLPELESQLVLLSRLTRLRRLGLPPIEELQRVEPMVPEVVCGNYDWGVTQEELDEQERLERLATLRELGTIANATLAAMPWLESVGVGMRWGEVETAESGERFVRWE